MDADIVSFARREYNLLMGERTAEEIKIAVGSAYPEERADRTVTFRGRDLLTGLPRSVEVGGDQIREALEPSIAQIIDAIKETIEETPPELVADIMDQGIVIAGGGALLAGLDRRVAEATQMPVHIADDPLTCVVRGTGRVLEDLDTLERVLVSEQYTRPHPLMASVVRSYIRVTIAPIGSADVRPSRPPSPQPRRTLVRRVHDRRACSCCSPAPPIRRSPSRRVTTRALDPVRGVLTGIGTGVAGVFGTIGEIDRLRSENAALRVALAGAEQRIAELCRGRARERLSSASFSASRAPST